jgi:hypothetical protein
LKDILDQRQHPVLIEAPLTQIRIFPPADFELPPAFGFFYGDARLSQSPTVFRPVVVLDNVERFITLLEPLFDEGEKHPVLIVLAVEKGTDMSGIAEGSSRQSNLPRWVAHIFSPVALDSGRVATNRSKCEGFHPAKR